MGLVAPRHGDLPRPGIEPVCPALADGFLTTVPPRKSHAIIIEHSCGPGAVKGTGDTALTAAGVLE